MLLAVLVFLALLAAEPEPPAADLPNLHPHVVVLVESSASLAERAFAAAAREARNIWRPYADVEFLASPAGASRDRGTADAELHLVIGDRPLPQARPNATGLGAIVFMAPDQPDERITVSAGAARSLADTAVFAGRPIADLPARVRDEFVARALGRTIAHEIGHYLLRSTAHTGRGLMRPEFTAGELMDERLERYRLEPVQIDRLRRQTPVRARTAQPAGANGRSGVS